MSRILAIDLGKFKSVTCLLDSDTNQTEFWTMSTDRHYLLAVLKNYHPDLVVIESCGLAGWVHDICTEEGYEVLVCNPNQEAWKWKHIKRKTDRDDALKLAKLAALGQLVPVYIPCRQQREYRRLVKYRQVVLGRINRVQNNIRAIFAQRGMEMVRGQKAWALERLELIAQHRKPLAECSLDDLWRGELDLELIQLEHLRQHQHEIHKQLKALARADERVQLLRDDPRRRPQDGGSRRGLPGRSPSLPERAADLFLRGNGPPTLSVGRDGSPGPDPQTGPTSAAQRTGRSGLADAALQPLGEVGLRPADQRAEDPQEEGDRRRGS